jgi:hypothetical protein
VRAGPTFGEESSVTILSYRGKQYWHRMYNTRGQSTVWSYQQLYRNLQNTLRKMLLDSGDEIYWHRMRQHTILYSGRTVRELLDHMEGTYGTFTKAERGEVTAYVAERAIRTWKNHFISILCSTDAEFPLKLWDHLLPQAQITLNLLRGSRVNPRLSAQAQLHGAFDFNRTPLGPPGTRVFIHELPDKRGTWSLHAVLGFCTGPASDHYRCFKVWVLETSSERIASTLRWFSSQVPLPRTSSADAATAAAHDLIFALQNPHAASPLSPITDEHQAALHQLATIFSSVAPFASSNNLFRPVRRGIYIYTCAAVCVHNGIVDPKFQIGPVAHYGRFHPPNTPRSNPT